MLDSLSAVWHSWDWGSWNKRDDGSKHTNTKQVITVWWITSTEDKVVDLVAYMFWSLYVLMVVMYAEDSPLYNKLPENKKQYSLFTDGSCCTVGKHWRWKAAVWSPTGQFKNCWKKRSSQFAEVKVMQLALYWVRKIAITLSLYWLVDSSICFVKMATIMEADQLAVQQ